jgi:hypothetical protein
MNTTITYARLYASIRKEIPFPEGVIYANFSGPFAQHERGRDIVFVLGTETYKITSSGKLFKKNIKIVEEVEWKKI